MQSYSLKVCIRSRLHAVSAGHCFLCISGTPKGTNIVACSSFVTGFQYEGERNHCSLFVDSIYVMCLFSGCALHLSIFSQCYVSIFSVCYERFLVCVMCGVQTRWTCASCVWLVSLASGRFAAAGCKSEHYCVRCSWLKIHEC